MRPLSSQGWRIRRSVCLVLLINLKHYLLAGHKTIKGKFFIVIHLYQITHLVTLTKERSCRFIEIKISYMTASRSCLAYCDALPLGFRHFCGGRNLMKMVEVFCMMRDLFPQGWRIRERVCLLLLMNLKHNLLAGHKTSKGKFFIVIHLYHINHLVTLTKERSCWLVEIIINAMWSVDRAWLIVTHFHTVSVISAEAEISWRWLRFFVWWEPCFHSCRLILLGFLWRISTRFSSFLRRQKSHEDIWGIFNDETPVLCPTNNWVNLVHC